jgi:cytochrome c5
MLKQALVMTFIASQLIVSSQLLAEEDRSAVLERIKPIGTVTIEGQQAEAQPEPAPAAAETPAAPAPAAPEAVAAAPASPAPAAADGQAVYNMACMACHMTGAAGAPKLGDKVAWGPRIATGRAALINSAINGKGAMPPKGGQMQLTEAEISAAVDYMVGASQ